MIDREKVIGLLQETAEYFRECRSNASFASKAENHFWELQNAANEAVELLKEQEEREKGICKEICGFIRESCSTDTDADKEYVCHVIHQCFINYGMPMEGR